jgi:hypothetical protein
MDAPGISELGTDRDRRIARKLERSPGAFFIERGRDLTLAAPYFNQRLAEGTYSGAAKRHLHNLCAATYAVLLSSFELTWKTLFARIIDRTTSYDKRLLDWSKSSVSVESLLAHRDQTSVGAMFASTFGAWQQPDLVNDRYERLLELRPFSNQDVTTLTDLWQLRHVIAHSSGIMGGLDAYRVSWDLPVDSALQLDPQFVEQSYAELRGIVAARVADIGTKLLDDFFSGAATGDWASDRETFSALYLLGHVVGQRQELPEVDEVKYKQQRLARQ